LERQVVRARGLAEEGAEAALARLAVEAKEPHGYLSADERLLRNRLRERARALGDMRRQNGTQEVDRLLEEVAYEAWHRMLFARFLAENNLLIHPEHGVPVSLAECEELAHEEGAEDRWVLAARYASSMLPQIFRPRDPSLQVAFAPEHRIGLEQLLEDLAPEVFRADDSLGWVYQFWQSERKAEVNASGEAITSETLPAVTQLFTEPYMVSFLLENTIGAWWSARHPGAAPPVEMPYLQRLEKGHPAIGAFDGWPASWSEFAVLDPCCGSGHFLVAALRLIVPLRMHDEGISARDSVDVVISENLFGLELDPRCTQIAAFAVALAAWTTQGANGYRPLPELQIACTGATVGARKEEWIRLAEGDQRLAGALSRLYDLFKRAPELGSLIDPMSDGEDLLTANFAAVRPLLERALASEGAIPNQEAEATAVAAQGIARAAAILARRYTLVATNVPYLGRAKQDEVLRTHLATRFPLSKQDLATAFLQRALAFLRDRGTSALVIPQNWLSQTTYTPLRRHLLTHASVNCIAALGANAFGANSGWDMNVLLLIISNEYLLESGYLAFDVSDFKRPVEKARVLANGGFVALKQTAQLENPDCRIVLSGGSAGRLLSEFAVSLQGTTTGDNNRYIRWFWEFDKRRADWALLSSSSLDRHMYGGRSQLISWRHDGRELAALPQARVQGWEAFGKNGVMIGQMADLPASIYAGDVFDMNAAALVPQKPEYLPAIWAFCSSPVFAQEVRRIDRKLNVTSATLVKVPFDFDYWSGVAAEQYPDGLPEPHSENLTQWLFKGDVENSSAPLHVAVLRLLGYRWPDQPVDPGLDRLVDADGIVCLPAVRGETRAADRISAFLAAAYPTDWSPTVRDRLLADVGFGGRTLADWVEESFFEQHASMFEQRPFIWHITDRAKGGFSALINYHKLERKTLETLTYTYLGDWISRQEEARNRDERGADTRLVAARELQEKLRLILEGEPPYDVFVRWKSLHQQPIGWEPDLNDGVRVNIWPFVRAGVFRSKVNVSWKKDRGKNAPGSYWGQDRYNRYEDIPPEHRPAELRNIEHLTNAVKRRAQVAHHGKNVQATSVEAPAKNSP
jgi:hypothetical protein